MLRNQRAYQFIYDWTKNRCAAAVGAWGGRMVGRAAVGLLGCLKKEQMSENALLQAAEAAKKCYLRPAADTDGWQALQPFGQTEVLVSVIVPVHNGEKDLKQCLNSILAQECGSTVEIIAVNDNSTDSSGDILEEYANWGEVRRVELTKETGGSAAKARNAGILQAKGEYLLFVDCDDVLLPGAISALLRKAQQTGADIVQGGWQYLDGDGKFGAAQRFAEHIYEKRTAYDCLDLPGTPWAKLYRRSLFDEIRFPAGYTCFEDAVIHFLIFPAAEKIASISQVVYAWRRNANGITFTSQGTKKAVQAYWIVEELLEQHRRIKQPWDELFYRNLTLQLSNYCYVCVAGLTEEEKQDALNQMWRNRSINDTYEPGSVFKVVTAAACLEEGVVTTQDQFHCPGYYVVEDRRIRCHKIGGHGSETFVQGIQNSCNPVFINIGLRLGVDRFCDYYDRFGLLGNTGVDLPGEASTIMHQRKNIGQVELATMSFGQSFQVTPIQMATTFSSIINGGNRVTPHFGKRVLDQDGTVAETFSDKKGKRILSEETSATMRALLESVVSEGGGKNAAVEGYRIGGKTATSQTLPRSANKYISSFVGFAPADDPQILGMCIIYNPQGVYYGGTIAAPVIGKIFENILPYLGIEKE